MANGWYYARSKQKVGPVSLDELRRLLASGHLQPTDMVLQDGSKAWVSLGAIEGIGQDARSTLSSKGMDRSLVIAGETVGAVPPLIASPAISAGGKPKQQAIAAARCDVFISYRRDGGSDRAQLVNRTLVDQGYRVFMDVRTLGSGHFDEALVQSVRGAADLVLILTRGCLDRCADEKDFVRREIAEALRSGLNIVPLKDPDFRFPGPEQLPRELRDLGRHNAIDYNHDKSDESLARLCRMLRSRPGLRPRMRRRLIAGGLLLSAILLVFIAWGSYRALVRDTSALRQDTAEVHEQTGAIQQDTNALRQDSGEIKKHATDIKKDTGDIKAGVETLGRLGGLIASPTRAIDFYHNALEYRKRGDIEASLAAFDGYFERDEREYIDPYLEYWKLVEGHYNELKVGRLLRALSERKPQSRAAKLVALIQGGTRDTPDRLRQFLAKDPDFLPAYPALAEHLPCDTVLEMMDQAQIQVDFNKQGGYERLKTFYLDREHEQCKACSKFGRDEPLDPARFFKVETNYEDHCKLLGVLFLEDKLPGKEVVLKFSSGAVARLPLKPAKEEKGEAMAFVELVSKGEQVAFERRSPNDVRIFPHCGYLKGVRPGPLSFQVEYVDGKGRSYSFPLPVEIRVPAFGAEVIQGRKAMLQGAVRGPQLRVCPYEFLRSCRVAARKEGPYVPVPHHESVPMLHEMPLERVPGYDRKGGPHVFWFEGEVDKSKEKLGPEPVEVDCPAVEKRDRK